MLEQDMQQVLKQLRRPLNMDGKIPVDAHMVRKFIQMEEYIY